MGLFDSLFGFDDARDDARRGRDEADAAISSGLSTFNTQADTAISTLAPDIGAGDDARESLLTAIGLRGRDAQSQFFSDFQSDPGFTAEVDFAQDRVESSAAARGGLFSGGTLKGIAENAQKFKRGAFNDRLDRLSGLARIGTGARQNTANIQLSKGDAAFGVGQLRANNAVNTNNAIAGTRGGGLNNLFRIGTQATKAAAGFNFGGRQASPSLQSIGNNLAFSTRIT